MSLILPVEPIIVGKIGAVYGTRGWLRMYSFTEQAESIFNYKPWYIRNNINNVQLINVERWKIYNKNKSFIIKIINIENRNIAKLLTNCMIIIDALILPKLSNNNYYWKDILGCNVINISGYHFGKVMNLIETGSNDVLVVKSNLKDMFHIKQRLIPYIDKQIIKKINIKKHIIEVDWDPSLDI